MTDDLSLPALVEPLNSYRLASLAREVAMNIRGLPEILATYKISQEDYTDIATWPFYKSALEAATIEWTGALSTHQRIKIEAATALEDALPKLSARMNSESETLTAAVETGKLLAKLAGIGDGAKTGDSGEKFSIVINLGEDKKLEFIKDITPQKSLIEQKEHTDEPS